jgi:hypothetical protein
MAFVERNRHLELTLGAFEIVDPNAGRPDHDMVLGRWPCDIERLTDEVTCLVRRTEPSANHGQAAKGAEMPGLIGEEPSIGLLGGLQGISAGKGDRRSHARPEGQSRFVHGMPSCELRGQMRGAGLFGCQAMKTSRRHAATRARAINLESRCDQLRSAMLCTLLEREPAQNNVLRWRAVTRWPFGGAGSLHPMVVVVVVIVVVRPGSCRPAGVVAATSCRAAP